MPPYKPSCVEPAGTGRGMQLTIGGSPLLCVAGLQWRWALVSAGLWFEAALC